MKYLFALFFFATGLAAEAQDETPGLTTGGKAPAFMLRNGNTLQSITMPYMKKIVLLNFWSSGDLLSGLYNDWIKDITGKYRNASYKTAEGFEVLAFAVQSDKGLWQESIEKDSLGLFTHFLASKGYMEEVCIKYSVYQVPYRILIDEEGTVLSVNPSMMRLENLLDERKNFQPLRKNVSGVLAQSSNIKDVLKFSKVYLFSLYGDSIARTVTNEKGMFLFEEVKLGHDYVLKLDNKGDINTSDPIALYTPKLEFITDGRTRAEGFEFRLGGRVCSKLIAEPDSVRAVEGLDQIDVIKSLSFTQEGGALTPKDMKELQPLLVRLKGNGALQLELTTHTDARTEPAQALELTSRQAKTLTNYFQTKGISPTRIKAIARGNSDLRKRCDGTIDCRDEDHLMNRRVEFLVYRD